MSIPIKDLKSSRQCKWLCLDWDGKTPTGRRCLLLGRPDHCPIHQRMKEPRSPRIISDEFVNKIIEELEEDDPWKEADPVEITQRAQGYAPSTVTYKGYTVTVYR